MSVVRFQAAAVDVPVDDGVRTIMHPTTIDVTERRTSVIGANGSGKSTLLRMVNGLTLPTVGSVTVDGADTRSRGHAVRRMVGFVFTDPLAQLVMPTGLEDVMLSLRRTDVPARDRRSIALGRISAFGLADHAEQSIYDLSGGQRQLMALASVLATSPRILVLDEPTTLLDLTNRERFRQALGGLDQQILFSTHDLELALDADRTIVVDAGTVLFDGPPPDAVRFYRGLAVAGAST